MGQLSRWVPLPSSPLCSFVSVTAEAPLMALFVTTCGLSHYLSSPVPSFRLAHTPPERKVSIGTALTFCWIGWAVQRLWGTKARLGVGRGLGTPFVVGTHGSLLDSAWLVFHQAEIQGM